MGKLREPLAEIAAECSLPQALEAMGERWSFMILRASFNGVQHFEEFLTELGIARNILANRLSRLVDNQVLKRTPCPEDRRKVEYGLTEKGLDLLPTMIALRQWGEKWESGTPSNPVLADQRDHRPISKISIRAHDDRILNHEDLCWIDENDIALSKDSSVAGNSSNGAVRKLVGV